MPNIVKLNYDRKVRYLFDKDTEECIRLADEVMNHYGQFLESPHGWWMEDIKRFQKVLRECGLSVSEFLREEFVVPKKTVEKPKRKPRKTATAPATKKKTPAKKPKVTRKKPTTTVTKKKTPVKKKTPTKRKKAA